MMMKFAAFLLCLIFIKQAYSLTCPAGTHLASCLTRCYPCSTGYYSYRGSRSCTICPKGNSCYPPSSPPSPCSQGQYQDQKGQRWCKKCSVGEYNTYMGRSTKCSICPVGHHCPYVSSPPIICLRGRYQDQTGQTSCKKCNSGEYSTEIGRSRKCDICPAGHRCYYKDSLPEKCREGQYQDKTGQTSCKSCKDGQYSLQIGSTECKSCPAGSKCPYANMKPQPCGKGEYSPPGSVKCLPCPVGSRCSSTGILTATSNINT